MEILKYSALHTKCTGTLHKFSAWRTPSGNKACYASIKTFCCILRPVYSALVFAKGALDGSFFSRKQPPDCKAQSKLRLTE